MAADETYTQVNLIDSIQADLVKPQAMGILGQIVNHYTSLGGTGAAGVNPRPTSGFIYPRRSSSSG